MNIISTKLPDVLVIEPKVFGDSRGYFFESWNAHRYPLANPGIQTEFVQDNLSLSRRGVLRGLHFQSPRHQGKLVTVMTGEVFDVVVDIRLGSPTWGQWVGVTLSGENHRQVWVPPGFAHGFAVVSEEALFSYKCTEYYHPTEELILLWNDPELAIDWPLNDPLVSGKDAAGIPLKELPRDRLKQFVR